MTATLAPDEAALATNAPPPASGWLGIWLPVSLAVLVLVLGMARLWTGG